MKLTVVFRPKFFETPNGYSAKDIGRENVCPHIDAALDRAREILDLPPAISKDPLEMEKKGLQEASDELALALERANQALSGKKSPGKTSSRDAHRVMP